MVRSDFLRLLLLAPYGWLCYNRDRISNCQKIKSIEYDNRIAFTASVLKVYEVRAPETFISFLAFIYDAVDEGEPPPW
ncbi:hypothetical protein Y032_0049g1881 [Ancylostoma ceylanicum]|uniref:Uncharacterized protein n=1 Tax=Ancylostoma ceylanicum TaxID=53326 RepID=A0A016U9I3_9BILA|nr:hypothetical protein Y032_0049g1881 [Ancylostoma ceylanicum]